jgi:predicted dehydrogenase
VAHDGQELALGAGGGQGLGAGVAEGGRLFGQFTVLVALARIDGLKQRRGGADPQVEAVPRDDEAAKQGRRAALDLVDAIATDREPETGMYAGRTIVEMTAAIYASALSGERITWPLVARANPLA